MKRVDKYIINGLLVLPGTIFLLFPILSDMRVVWKKLLLHSGFITISLLIFSLAFPPLNRLFPKVPLFKFFSHFRRETGLAVFFYASFHFFFFIMRVMERKGRFDLSCFFRPIVATGLCAFLILFVLAVTSNEWSIKNMGYHNWKRLHRLIYLSEIFVFFHVFFKSTFYAFVLILPLVSVQLICFIITKKNRLNSRL